MSKLKKTMLLLNTAILMGLGVNVTAFADAKVIIQNKTGAAITSYSYSFENFGASVPDISSDIICGMSRNIIIFSANSIGSLMFASFANGDIDLFLSIAGAKVCEIRVPVTILSDEKMLPKYLVVDGPPETLSKSNKYFCWAKNDVHYNVRIKVENVLSP